MDGLIFNIQRFCINDGPGIRTTVFFKGCPLDCIWCHNPESKSIESEMFYDADKCVGCQRCENVCPLRCHSFKGRIHLYNRNSCITCGKCADVCMTGALETVGDRKTVEKVLEEVLKDKIFYENSGGGITLSGGEPMMQFEFAYDLLKASKRNSLHTCMETCGFAKEENYKKIAELVDIFLFDYKEVNTEKHKEFTGVSNELIFTNLKMLDAIGAKIILRCPIIPTLNDREEHFQGIAEMASILNNIIEINIEPYHPLGMGKAHKLDKNYPLSELSFSDNDTVEKWIRAIQLKTSIPVKKA